jgi:glucose-6-phosphate isomerase
MKKTDELKAWQKTKEHFENIKNLKLREIFHYDEDRFERFHIELDGLVFDYSKNIFNYDTLAYLLELSQNRKLEFGIRDFFAGAKLNHTEGRSVLHTALRAGYEKGEMIVDGEDIGETVSKQLEKMKTLVEAVHNGGYLGHTGKTINRIVNIGIGGSDLGPRMVSEALKPFTATGIAVDFVSNVDPTDLRQSLQQADLERTLFIICSKTFTSLETMANATTAKKWLQINTSVDAVAEHFIAVTSDTEAANNFGIKDENIIGFRDWVGGRFSLWSPIGLAIAMQIGWNNFEDMLEGARSADEHFKKAPLTHNIPVIMGLMGVWYRNFFGYKSHAIVPYSESLRSFPAFIQQLDMESNGKHTDQEGRPLNYKTSPTILGAAGTDAQHSFFQHLHQSSDVTPVDFILPVVSNTQGPGELQHDLLVANCLAQSQALMNGKTRDEAIEEMEQSGIGKEEIERLLPYKTFAGNRPSNTFLVPQINPKYIGMMIAMYEHKTFVQGWIWYINSFDQYGVELGKTLAKDIITDIGKGRPSDHDASTVGLLTRYLAHKL